MSERPTGERKKEKIMTKINEDKVIVRGIESAKAVTVEIDSFNYNMLVIDEQIVEVSKMDLRMAGIVSCALSCKPIYEYLNVTLSEDKEFVAWVKYNDVEVNVFVAYYTKDFLRPELVIKPIFRREILRDYTYMFGPSEKMCELGIKNKTVVITYYWHDKNKWKKEKNGFRKTKIKFDQKMEVIK